MVAIPPRFGRRRNAGEAGAPDQWSRGPLQRGREALALEPGRTHCQVAGSRRLLLRYAFETCSEPEATEFEGHVLGCEACFEDLKCLDRSRELVREFTKIPSAELNAVRRTLERERRCSRFLCGLLLLAGFVAGVLLGVLF